VIKRAIVIESPGAGKSTFARKLKDKTGLPLYYLDRIFELIERYRKSRRIIVFHSREEADNWIETVNSCLPPTHISQQTPFLHSHKTMRKRDSGSDHRMIHFLPFGNYRTLMCVLFPDVFLL